VVLAQQGHEVILLDNLCNSQISVLANLEKITGQKLPFYEADVRDGQMLRQILLENQVEAVVHFAGLKSVSESAQDPLRYYDNNVGGTISLIEAMQAQKIKKLIFSSSATVYGVSHYLPCDEEHPLAPINAYGKSKLQAEEIMQDLVKSDPSWAVVALRYFNPIGAHESGLIGEVPNGVPNNLMPYVCQVASGKLPYLNVFGDDYETKDGTGERDYIHVMDLAEGHLAALHYINQNQGFEAVNLGTGNPYSVYEVITAFEKSANRTITKKVQPRRDGDLPIYFAKAEKAKILLGWQAKRDLQVMCDSSWKYEKSLRANSS
jgi:UDP-glucose 4-epimerase